MSEASGNDGGTAEVLSCKRQPSLASLSPLVAVVRGLLVFLASPGLWPKVVCPILISLVSTLLSLSFLLGFAYRPQAEALIGCGMPSWVAWPTALLMVLLEVGLVNLIVLLVLFGQVQSQIFLRVLEKRGVLAKLHARRGANELPEQSCHRDACHSIAFLFVRLPLLLLTLPLNGIPVLGQVAWVGLNGWLYAWELEANFLVMFQEHYYCGEQLEFVRERFGAFASFGAAAMGLELIPFLGPWVFFASNACGAALLAERFYQEMVDIEQGSTMRTMPQATEIGAATTEIRCKAES